MLQSVSHDHRFVGDCKELVFVAVVAGAGAAAEGYDEVVLLVREPVEPAVADAAVHDLGPDDVVDLVAAVHDGVVLEAKGAQVAAVVVDASVAVMAALVAAVAAVAAEEGEGRWQRPESVEERYCREGIH